MVSVSVVMATYAEPLDWIDKAVNSILNQTLGNLEFIIVNDNPERTDLHEFLCACRDRDPRIRITRNESNLGAGQALDSGLDVAQGKYVAIPGADDISAPERLQMQYDFLQEHPDVFVVGSAVETIDDDDNEYGKRFFSQEHDRIVANLLAGQPPVCTPSIMFRNEGCRYRGRFRIAPDADLYLRLLSDGKRFANLGQVLLQYRISCKSISAQKKRQQTIMKLLAFHFYRERQQTGRDSYDEVDFDDLDGIVRFLGVEPRQLELQILQEEIVFALQGRHYAEARAKYREYAALTSPGVRRLVLWTFANIPVVHRLYRKIRYGSR